MEYFNITTTTSSMVPWNEKAQILANTFIRAGLVLMYSFIFLVCFFGNLAVILVVWSQRRTSQVSKFGIASMAVANFSVSLFCILPILTWFLVDTWIFGELLCQTYHFIANLCHAASIQMSVCISIERYVVILHSIRCRQILTTRRLMLSILGVLLLSAGISFPRFFYFGLIRAQRNENEDFPSICGPINFLYNSATADVVEFLLMYLIPLVILSALYLRAGLFLRRSREIDEWNAPAYVPPTCASKCQEAQKNLDELVVEGKMNVHLDTSMSLCRYNRLQLSHVRFTQRQRLVQRFVFIVITFALLNLPYHLHKLCVHYLPSFDVANDANNLITPFAIALMYANCAVNPILYAFLSKNFRASLRDLSWKGEKAISTV